MSFELVLFSINVPYIQEAVAAGVDTIIVDWERRGKIQRQMHANTEINDHTVADLQRVSAHTTAHIICRINPFHENTADEIEAALSAGADEILLPMVRQVEEVEEVFKLTGNRCRLGILIETKEAANSAKKFSHLPLSRVYVGLNDLAIECASPSIFHAFLDGTVDNIRQAFTVPFGVCGLTLPDRGFPIPCWLIIGELMRLNCQFSFLRRSFHHDSQNHALSHVIPKLRQALEEATHRPVSLIELQKTQFHSAIMALSTKTYESPK